MKFSGKTSHKRKVVIFGSLGQIGSRVLGEARRAGHDVLGLEWDEAPRWIESGQVPASADYVVAFGLTDPKLTREEHLKSNFTFPKTLCERLSGTDFRMLTIGSILERFPEVCQVNPYLSSKLELSRWVASKRVTEPSMFLHTRLHTLYSKDIKPHMFLGQIYQALRSGVEFKMSTGEQLREYHHADDIARSMVNVLAHDWSQHGGEHLEFNSGRPVRLCDLAETVFRTFGKSELLKLGALGKVQKENWETTFTRSDSSFFVDRDALSGVCDVFKLLIK